MRGLFKELISNRLKNGIVWGVKTPFWKTAKTFVPSLAIPFFNQRPLLTVLNQKAASHMYLTEVHLLSPMSPWKPLLDGGVLLYGAILSPTLS